MDKLYNIICLMYLKAVGGQGDNYFNNFRVVLKKNKRLESTGCGRFQNASKKPFQVADSRRNI